MPGRHRAGDTSINRSQQRKRSLQSGLRSLLLNWGPHSFLPFAHFSRDDAKDRIRLRRPRRLTGAEPCGVALRRLAPKMRPFVKQLPLRLVDQTPGSFRPDFRSVEMITPGNGFIVDGTQVTRQRCDWPGRGEKGAQLRMMPVAALAYLPAKLSAPATPRATARRLLLRRDDWN